MCFFLLFVIKWMEEKSSLCLLFVCWLMPRYGLREICNFSASYFCIHVIISANMAQFIPTCTCTIVCPCLQLC